MNKSQIQLVRSYLILDIKRFWSNLASLLVLFAVLVIMQLSFALTSAESTVSFLGQSTSSGLGLGFGSCVALCLQGTPAANMTLPEEFSFPIAWLALQLVMLFAVSRFTLTIGAKCSFFEFIKGGKFSTWYWTQLIFCTFIISSFYAVQLLLVGICALITADGGIDPSIQMKLWSMLLGEVTTAQGLAFIGSAWLVNLALAYLQFTLSLIFRVTPVFIVTMGYFILCGIYQFPALVANLTIYLRADLLVLHGYNTSLIALITFVCALLLSGILFSFLKKRDLGFLKA